MSYKVKLEIFEGPLDLLLYLIKKNQIDIYDIPIAEILNQYLEYIELMRMLDLDIAGEFLVMAATLIHIKSKMLLPPEEIEDEQEDEDPRQELVRKLLEYKRFKEAASNLEILQKEHEQVFTRMGLEKYLQDYASEKYFEADLFDLLSAFSKVMKDIPKEAFCEIIKDEVSIEEKMSELLDIISMKVKIYFSMLFQKVKSKIEVATIFLALLELIRLKKITVCQISPFSEIEIMKTNTQAVNTGEKYNYSASDDREQKTEKSEI